MSKFHVTKISTFIILFCVAIAALAVVYINKHIPISVLQSDQPFTLTVPKNTSTNSSVATSSTTAQPQTFLLPVPFTPQAPTANWDQLHNEACEEAVAIMANAYFSGDTETLIPADKVEAQISTLTNWEQQNFGYSLDTTDAETAQMIQSVYHLQTKLIPNFSADDLKQALLVHQLVIISEDGQMLGNPNYKQPGPIHHMLLIRGYTSLGFITNDSGTRRGQNYFYTFDTIKNAAADWDHTTNTVDTSKKIAIVVWK